tara:strand:- start:6230 stop:7567 length:1338 start_codon:yes stop_codon:yes gene_type:complete
MPTPSTRTPVRIARGSFSNLNGSISDLQDGEISYAEDQNKLYVKEGSSLVALTFSPADPAFTGTITGVNLTLSGNLTVNGTTTTIDSTTLQVEDKNIEIGKVASPSDATADGGGWSLLGSTTKTFNWVNATDAWTSSEHIVLAANKRLLIGTTTEGDSAADDLTIATSGNTGMTIRSSATGFGSIYFSDATSGTGESAGYVQYNHNSNALALASSGTTALAIDSSQRVLIGETTAITTSSNRLLQVVGDTNGGGIIVLGRNDTTLTNESLGGIEFYGNDPGSAFSRTAGIYCEAAAEWTSNDYPSKIIFKTTPDGSSTNTLALTIDSSQNATFAGTVSDSKGDLRKTGHVSSSSQYTFGASDAGNTVLCSSGGWLLNTGFNSAGAGAMITIVNNSGSNQTLTTSGVTLYNTADGSTGNRTIATRGMATIYHAGGGYYYISGAGLS